MKKKIFKQFARYIKQYDGMGKAKINFQDMYAIFPDFEFIADKNFGAYRNYGKAFEQKVYDMKVVAEGKYTCYLVYREYGDQNENLAYVDYF